MRKKYLTLEERWAMDVEAAKDGGTMISSTPQCKMCKYWIKGNALQCEKYAERKPKETLRCKKECPEFEHIDKINIKLQTKELYQILGGIFGFVVADALGVPVEFTSREERQKDPVKEMRAYGTYHQHFGTWSDDSSMTFCLMDCLKDGYNLRELANKFCKFYYECHWTPHNEVFDIGITTVQAIEKMKTGVEPVKCGGSTEKDNGNGSLMRILPLSFYLQSKNQEEKIKMIEDISSLTHAHNRSKIACIIYVELGINLIKGFSKNEAYGRTQDFILQCCKNNYQDEFVTFSRLLTKDISQLKESEIKSSGYVVDTLEAALWSFLSSESYSDTIFKAINLGGDTDTIAAIAGGLAGLFYGIDSINDNWIQCLARKKDIFMLISEFSKSL